MAWLRKFIGGIFGFEALFLVPVLPMGAYQMLRNGGYKAGSIFWFYLLGFAGATLIGTLFFVAWRAIKNNKGSARGLGVTASLVNVLMSLLLIRYLQLNFLSIVWFVPASGVIGLYVFSRRFAPALGTQKTTTIRSLPGDGTNRLINKIASYFGIVASIGVTSWWFRWANSNDISTSHGVLFYIEIVAALLVVVTVHELGHTVVGCTLGMKLRSFVTGPLQWDIREGKWRFRFNPMGIISPEGAVGVVPTSSDERRWRDICMLAAGPGANLCLAVISLSVAFTAESDAPLQTLGLLALLGAFSLLIGVVNLVPFHTGSNYSDGARIYQLLARGPFADLHHALSVVGSSLVTPLRSRDFDIELIQRAACGVVQRKQVMLLRLFAYQYYLDNGQMREAMDEMSHAETIYPELASEIPAELHSGFVFGNAYLKRDAGSTREWWERMEAKKPTRFNGDYWMAHSALHWIEGSLDVANESWTKGNALAQQLPDAGAYEFDRHCFSLLRVAIDQCTVAQSSSRELGALQPA
jgi:hypothetical protein